MDPDRSIFGDPTRATAATRRARWIRHCRSLAWVAAAVLAAPPAGRAQATASETFDGPLPPRNAVLGAPRQDDSAQRAPFFRDGHRLVPVARFQVKARVLSARHYPRGSDREAEIAPVDLALGWDRMSEDSVLQRLRISQSGRFYTYRWTGDPPVSLPDMVRSSANMHLVPANAAVRDALVDVPVGAVVTVGGWLVDVEGADGWEWRTSRTREDSGPGSCEIIWVDALSVDWERP